jgi:cell division protein FtsW (lipid II flippase)
MDQKPATHPHGHTESEQSFVKSRAFFVLLGFLAIVVVLLWQEHQAHILGTGLLLLILACPLMHLFMHRGGHSHSGHGGHKSHNNNETVPSTDEEMKHD